jgi:hypothetical protein
MEENWQIGIIAQCSFNVSWNTFFSDYKAYITKSNNWKSFFLISYILIALYVRLFVEVPKWAALGVGTFQARCGSFRDLVSVTKQTWCLSVCVFVTDIRGLRPGQWDERALRSSVCLPSFLSLFLSFCLSIHPSVSPSVHPSFFSSLTSPSSLAPFSVSLIYIFLISFLGSHVIGLFSMCSNVHTIAYMQLLDFLYCQFCTWNIWFQISTYLKDFSWKINGPKLARLCGKKKFIKH